MITKNPRFFLKFCVLFAILAATAAHLSASNIIFSGFTDWQGNPTNRNVIITCNTQPFYNGQGLGWDRPRLFPMTNYAVTVSNLAAGFYTLSFSGLQGSVGLSIPNDTNTYQFMQLITNQVPTIFYSVSLYPQVLGGVTNWVNITNTYLSLSTNSVTIYTYQTNAIGLASTITGAPGSQAAVTNLGSSTAPVLQFTIPTGATGPQGPSGPAATNDVTNNQPLVAFGALTNVNRLYGQPYAGGPYATPWINLATGDASMGDILGDIVGCYTGQTEMVDSAGDALILYSVNNTLSLSAGAIYAGNAAGMSNVPAAKIVGIVPTNNLPMSQLGGSVPSGLVTNNQTGVNLGGTFTGNGSGLTGLTGSNVTGVVPTATNAMNGVPGGNIVTNNPYAGLFLMANALTNLYYPGIVFVSTNGHDTNGGAGYLTNAFLTVTGAWTHMGNGYAYHVGPGMFKVYTNGAFTHWIQAPANMVLDGEGANTVLWAPYDPNADTGIVVTTNQTFQNLTCSNLVFFTPLAANLSGTLSSATNVSWLNLSIQNSNVIDTWYADGGDASGGGDGYHFCMVSNCTVVGYFDLAMGFYNSTFAYDNILLTATNTAIEPGGGTDPIFLYGGNFTFIGGTYTQQHASGSSSGYTSTIQDDETGMDTNTFIGTIQWYIPGTLVTNMSGGTTYSAGGVFPVNSFSGNFSGNGSGLTNVSSASISVVTNSAPTNAITPLFWIGITNGTSVYKVPLYR